MSFVYIRINDDVIKVLYKIYEPHHEKTGFLHM